jgi:hypothetical protein
VVQELNHSLRQYLIPYQKYQEIEHQVPYFFKIGTNDQCLYYFGSKHSYDPNDSQFHELAEKWKEFISTTKEEDSVVLVEGGKRPYIEDEIESIQQGGEASFITTLAQKAGIEAESPEPEESLEREQLLKKFTPDEIQYYYFARVVYQWSRKDPQPNFEEYVTNYLEQDQHSSKWNFDFSMKNMMQIHQKLFNTPFDKTDADFFYNSIDPTQNNCVINDVSRESGVIRDLEIVVQIKKHWEEGKSIYVVYGASHAVMQEPALRYLTNKSKGEA